jgi:dipicolinate synthase subunit A
MIIDKTYLIAGGDLRQLYLAKALAQKGNKVYITCFDEAYELDKRLIPVDQPFQIAERLDCIVLPLPVTNDGVTVNTPFSKKYLELETVLNQADTSTVIFGGKIEKPFQALCNDRGLEVVDYLEREEFAVLNAVPTAEGALEILMQELPTTLFGTKCLITGFGRISKVLAKYLTALGVTVTIAARKYSDLAWAKVYGCEGIHISRMAEVAGDFDYIVNTVPAKIFHHGVLSKLKDRCLVLDLASKPGGAGSGDKEKTGCI